MMMPAFLPRPSSCSSAANFAAAAYRSCNTSAGTNSNATTNKQQLQLLWRRGGRRRPPLASPPYALQDAAAAVLVAGVVGVAANLLLRQQQQQRDEEEEEEEEPVPCGECGGTGLCGRCEGEGFVFKQVSEETATKARRASKNAATRYTSGLPTKWTYCNKCSSTRSCTTCGGSGRIMPTSSSVASTGSA